MLKNHYYCFIAGLPDLIFEETKFPSTLQEFKQELEHELGPEDYDKVKTLFYPYDHENLIRFLLKEENGHNPLGNFTQEDFEEQIYLLKDILEHKPLLPGYMVRFILDFLDEEKEQEEEEFEKTLMEGFYEHVRQTGNAFLDQWYNFDLDSRNILTALVCRKYELDMEQELIGRNPLATELLGTRRKGLEITTDDDYLAEVMLLADVEDFFQREKRFDLLKWDYLDEHTFFHYFTIEKIIAYLIKLFIVFRWKKLDPETGREMFERLIGDLRSSYELPEEFSLYKR